MAQRHPRLGWRVSRRKWRISWLAGCQWLQSLASSAKLQRCHGRGLRLKPRLRRRETRGAALSGAGGSALP